MPLPAIAAVASKAIGAAGGPAGIASTALQTVAPAVVGQLTTPPPQPQAR